MKVDKEEWIPGNYKTENVKIIFKGYLSAPYFLRQIFFLPSSLPPFFPFVVFFFFFFFNCQAVPQLQQCRIRAMSATHTTDHGNAGSLTP